MGKASLSVLVVSYYFPPNAEVGGRRISRFCQYLPGHGIHPTVLTIDEKSCNAIDLSFRPSEELQIVRARPDRTFLDWYRDTRMKSKRVSSVSGPSAETNKRTKTGLAGSLRRHFFSLLQMPDSFGGWYRPAFRAAENVVNASSIDAVFSSGPPWTAHAVAHAIARKRNLPWFVEFRDAYAVEPWRKYTMDSMGPPAWRDPVDLWLEDRWVRRACRVICLTKQQRDSLLQVHPRLDPNRVVIISNGIDDRGRQSMAGRRDAGPRILLHAGSLYGGRGIDVFCKALSSLIHTGKIHPEEVRVILMGEVHPDIAHAAKTSAAELFANGVVSFRPRLDWGKAQENLWKADVLLIFQGHHSTAIPAKFFEYLRTGKPILTVAGEGALRDIVLETGSGVVADPDDQSQIASAITSALEATPRTAQDVEAVIAKFDFRNLTTELARCMWDALQ